jgi:hypothetical protein
MRFPTSARTVACAAVTAAQAACAAAPATPPVERAGLADADSLRVSVIEPGVRYIHAWWSQGPWAADVVEIDRDRCRPLILARKPGSDLAARETTSRIARDAGDLVAINADFFMLPGGTPVGAHVERGVPLIGPSDRQIVAVDDDGLWIGIASVAGFAAHRADTARMAQINRSPVPFSAYAGTGDGLTLFTRWIGDTIPHDAAGMVVRMRRLAGDEAAGRAVVSGRANAAVGRVTIAADEAILLAHGSARAWAQRRGAGDTVAWSARIVPRSPRTGAAPAVEALGGFPELIRDGRVVLAEQTVRPEFGAQRHPRTAIGWDAGARRIWFVVVDGRQPPWSDGMSLDELTWLFRRLGATDALNLDGGGSTALVIRGDLVNRPSDTQGERAVGNALSLARCTR